MMRMMVCLDGSELSRSVLRVARPLAWRTDADVRVAQVIDSRDVDWVPAAMFAASAYDAGYDERIRLRERERQAVRRALEATLMRFPRGATAVVENTAAATGIIEYASQHEIDLIAMSTHCRGPLSELVFGSVTHTVIRSGVAPVLVVHPTDQTGDEGKWPTARRMKMLVCLDGSEYSHTILPAVRHLAMATGAEVELIRVITASEIPQRTVRREQLGAPPWPGFPAGIDPHIPHARYSPEYDWAAEGERIAEVRYAAAKEAERAAEEDLAADLTDFPEDTSTVVLHGDDAADSITAYASHIRADLVAMATHSRRPIAEILAGSVTDAVIRSGVAPALVVHPTR